MFFFIVALAVLCQQPVWGHLQILHSNLGE